MNYTVFDMETDGLIDTVTRVHCVCATRVKDGNVSYVTLTSKQSITDFFESEEVLVGHNISRSDIPVIKKLIPGINIKARLIDTLGLSWYLYPERLIHGLEEWGNDFDIQKPPIEDWSNLSVEEYIYRCSEDVKINVKLFQLELEYLNILYNGDSEQINRIIGYLMFKLDCAAEQEEMKWKLDSKVCQENLAFLEVELQSKFDIVKSMMPPVKKYKMASRPAKLYKIDGSLSEAGKKWLAILANAGLPDHHVGAVEILYKQVEPNPGSHTQLKDWLFSLGWIPETFNYIQQPDIFNDEGQRITVPPRAIPQINTKDDGICESVKALYEAKPDLVHLEGYFVVRHRIGLLNGFLRDKDENDLLKAEISGFTNTLRFKHKTIVNLPQIPKPYWDKIRGCLISPDENHVLCGSDMSSLENNTKLHYMYFYDPEYVKEILTPGFDSHIDIAVLSKAISHDEGEFYKYHDNLKEKKEYIYRPPKAGINPTSNNIVGLANGYTFQELLGLPENQQKEILKTIKGIRLRSKKVNFGAVYGAGGPKLALTGGFSIQEGYTLHRIYWARNKAVKLVAQNCIVKTIGRQMWLYNPIAQFWYSLRHDKDRFSTLNQGTGVYCFDTWVRHVRKQEVKNCGQFHDEIISPILKSTEEAHKQKLLNAIQWTNDELKLNIPLSISVDFGDNYAQIH